MEVENLYKVRFDQKEVVRKNQLWTILCKHFFNRFVNKNDCVLDLAAGYCDFINNIEAQQKIAVDINPDTAKYANPDVSVVKAKSSEITLIESDSVDVIFVSNFFEHITKEEISATLNECKRILKYDGGRIIIMQPNIKYVGAAYWDFFDHHTPLTDKSLTEVLEMTGLSIKKIIPRFLPYTTKSKIPQFGWLVKIYLYFPLIWRIMGQQTLVVAEKRQS